MKTTTAPEARTFNYHPAEGYADITQAQVDDLSRLVLRAVTMPGAPKSMVLRYELAHEMNEAPRLVDLLDVWPAGTPIEKMRVVFERHAIEYRAGSLRGNGVA